MKELEQPRQSVPKGRRFCTVCGEIKRETHFEGDSTHCAACCQKMLHTHVRWYGVLTLVLLLALCAAAAMLGVQTARFCRMTRQAERLAADQYLSDACDLYESAVAELPKIDRALLLRGAEDGGTLSFSLFEAGTHTWERYAAVYARTNSELDAASMLADQLDADQIARNAALSAYGEAKTAYNEIADAIDAMNNENPYEAPEDMPYDAFMQMLDDFEKNNDSRYYKGYAEMFKGSATQYYYADDTALAIPYYEKALEYMPDEVMTLCESIANAARTAKQWDALQKAGETLLSANRSYIDAYDWIVRACAGQDDFDAARKAAADLHAASPDRPLYQKLLVQIALLDGDLASAEAVCDAAKSLDDRAAQTFNTLLAKRTLPTESQRFFREYVQYATLAGVVRLLGGDKKAALDYAYERSFNYAYYLESMTDSSAISQQMIDVAYICAAACENADANAALAQMGSCGEDAQKVIDGKLTAEQAFLQGEADLL